MDGQTSEDGQQLSPILELYVFTVVNFKKSLPISVESHTILDSRASIEPNRLT